MNKYQELLDSYCEECDLKSKCFNSNEICLRKLNLQELVDKATPIKIHLVQDVFRCPTCNGIQAMNIDNFCYKCQNEYCGKCGQRLDWSD